MEAVLMLKNGAVFKGESIGAPGTVLAEAVFNTAMTGYEEVLTDPSYRGQMVVFTYPLIGNYGITGQDGESGGVTVEGVIVRELCRQPSNYRAVMTLDAYLKKNGTCGIQGIDTRMLTRMLRDSGSVTAVLSTEIFDEKRLLMMLEQKADISSCDLVSKVTSAQEYVLRGGQETRQPLPQTKSSGSCGARLAVIDLGIKRSILRMLQSAGCALTVLPAEVTPERIREINPRGIFLSNGPGDPQAVKNVIRTVASLLGSYPIIGICLGHQITALAAGAKTFKLKFGHHGSNHPVQCCESGSIAITAQNHNYAVDETSARTAGFEITHRNLNDGTVEGMRHRNLRLYTLQFHPEASPGPHDAAGAFAEFKSMIESVRW